LYNIFIKWLNFAYSHELTRDNGYVALYGKFSIEELNHIYDCLIVPQEVFDTLGLKDGDKLRFQTQFSEVHDSVLGMTQEVCLIPARIEKLDGATIHHFPSLR